MSSIINIYLLWGAWQDVRKQTISNRYLWLGGIIGIIYNLIKMITEGIIWRERFTAYVPGLLILVIAKVTNEKIGFGDGWVIMVLGSFLKINEIYLLLQLAVILAAAVSMGLLCMKKAGRECKLPFLPFLCVAYAWQWRSGYA